MPLGLQIAGINIINYKSEVAFSAKVQNATLGDLILGRSTNNSLLYSNTEIHNDGLFPCSILEYKIVTPAGVVRANSSINADIYYAIPYSQGSFPV
jgi:hypothetical protein